MLKKLFLFSSLFMFMVFIAGCYELSPRFTRGAGTSQNDIDNTVGSKDLSRDTDENKAPKPQSERRRQRYVVDRNDVLKIEVFDEPYLSTTTKISEDGMLSYPFIGEVKVLGLTTQEVEKLLEERLKDGYLKDPKVTVLLDVEMMQQYQEKEVFVMGHVRNPGAIPLLGKYISVLEAISKAGGFSEFAAPNRTKIMRVENGVKKIIKVNLKKAIKGDKSQDIILKPGDIINVPPTIF